MESVSYEGRALKPIIGALSSALLTNKYLKETDRNGDTASYHPIILHQLIFIIEFFVSCYEIFGETEEKLEILMKRSKRLFSITTIKNNLINSLQPRSLLFVIQWIVSTFNEYIPYNVLVTLNPVLDSTANHDLLFFAQAIRISQVWWNFEGTAPFGFRYENISIVFMITVEFFMEMEKKKNMVKMKFKSKWMHYLWSFEVWSLNLMVWGFNSEKLLVYHKNTLPSLLTKSDFELADNERKRAAEFGRYVSNEADNSINGFKMPCFKMKM